ncbi:hypothetical protein TD95_000649 [Thielaviopsis punctulata]|uniref:Uncharacterized protein n=1 Tax=Thielaviopsis punctulata TaxID=72032 RepID=A0A0F4ZJR9_9PEZI|nr:hypothetical protein TD95_000649 [Thielaviopsis punctulata]
MPHVRRAEYVHAPAAYTLEYVEVVSFTVHIHRRHKRTPYTSNALSIEPYPWNCPATSLLFTVEPVSGTSPSAKAYLMHLQTSQNKWRPPTDPGTCVFPQITAAGLDDSRVHSEDLYAAYHDVLRTHRRRVARQGCQHTARSMPLLIEPDGIDSLEPQMPCAVGSALFRATTSSVNRAWSKHLAAAAPLFARLDAISGCHGKPLPCRLVNGKNSSAYIIQSDADAVYRMRNLEYVRIYCGAPPSLNALATTFGTWIATLADHLCTLGGHNIAHDGSMARLLSVLQVAEMVWLGMGMEVVVFKLYTSR